MNMSERIEAMRALAPNWDGYGADAPDTRTLTVAQEFLTRIVATLELDEPQVVPSRTGGICALWDLDSYELEMGIERKDDTVLVDYLFESNDGKDLVEGRFQFQVNEYLLPGTLHALTRQIVDNGNRVAA
jgi:hypothetical protein